VEEGKMGGWEDRRMGKLDYKFVIVLSRRVFKASIFIKN
jgi:hypothetical protein